MVDSDLSTLPNEVIRTALCDTVENKLKTNKFNIKVSSASEVGTNNFIGVVYRITFNKEDDNENPSKLILKVAPQNVNRREQFMARPCFLLESFMYDTVLPYFRQFEESKGVIVKENGFTEYPKCYRIVDQDMSECVLLEDLSVRQFSIIDRYTQEISADHVRLVMRTLGKYHAISFALKDQQPEKFKELSSELTEIFIRPEDPNLRDYFVLQLNVLYEALRDEKDALVKQKLEKFFERNPMDIAADCLDTDEAGWATVISHGDLWQNNTMFSYENSGKVKEICLLDWQLSRHSSPIIDLVYFIFFCTTKELRDAHYEEFQKIYHESLSAHIRRLGSDPEKLFPYKLMLEHFRKFAKFALVLASVLLPVITAESESKVDLDELAAERMKNKSWDSNKFVSTNSQNKLNKRMRGVAIDMHRLEYI